MGISNHFGQLDNHGPVTFPGILNVKYYEIVQINNFKAFNIFVHILLSLFTLECSHSNIFGLCRVFRQSGGEVKETKL